MSHNNTVRLEVGTRVRNWNHLFWGAHWWGTGTITEVLKQHVGIDDTWEYLVRFDYDGEIHQWNIVDTTEGNEWIAAEMADTPHGIKYLARIERLKALHPIGTR
ncbi:hypothetical protein KXR83_05920 [Williamsia muralis]|uniref:hypothetical protein n=1 Tax=Williamsia marianensis TaxID=85044 RepID=UPI003F161ADD